MEKKNSYTIALTPAQMEAAAEILRTGNYRLRKVPYTVAAAEGPDCQISVFTSGKCLVQGKGAYDWITFVLEPEVLGEARLGYEEQLDPKALEPHMGVDESGKGDFFGPLVVAAAYVDADIVRDLRAMDVRDSKAITTDRAARELARKIRERLGEGRYTVVRRGPAAYNRMYGSMGSVTRILAWGHAKCIENLLEKVPECPRAISDQFGPEHQIKRALQERGRKIVLEQHPRAEADTAVAAAEGPDCQIAVSKSGKCLVQGKGAYDWITFVLEPEVLGEARLGYEDQLDPKALEPHMGVDESGKGDFFGPLVVAAAYVDADIVRDLRAMDVRDSKAITTDRAARELARKIRERLGPERYTLVRIEPQAYNKMYEWKGSVNRILAWGHAMSIENLLKKVPDCPRAISDQFGPEYQIKRALQERGRNIVLEQYPKAESDTAVAAASILARDGFLSIMDQLGKKYGRSLPKGASPLVKAAARELVEKHGGKVFLEVAKCHFKTADDVLGELGRTREGEGLPPAPVHKPFVRFRKAEAKPEPPPRDTLF